MPFSVFELFKPGVGPSISHTMGPMTAALRFVSGLEDAGVLRSVTRVEVELFGSLAASGKGHRTDAAVQVGLAGFDPATVDAGDMAAVLAAIRSGHTLPLAGKHPIPFDPNGDIVFSPAIRLPFHPNALRFTALYGPQDVLESRTYYSIGGGSVLEEGDARGAEGSGFDAAPYPFRTGAELLAIAERSGLTVAGVMRANERVHRPDEETDRRLDLTWARMASCVERGLAGQGMPRRTPFNGHVQIDAKGPVEPYRRTWQGGHV